MIEFKKEEKEFLQEFKNIMIDGLVIKKPCRFFGYVFRKIYIKPEKNLFCWDSKKENVEFIHYEQIFEISRKKSDIPFKVSDELSKRYLIIKVNMDNKKYDPNKKYLIKKELNYKKYIKNMIIEFVNSYSCDLFYDGIQLLLKEYQNHEIEKKNKKNRRSIVKRILIEEDLLQSSDEEK